MVHFLNLYKQVKANNGYQRHADKARCPKTKQQGESSRELSHVGSRKGKGMSQYAESEWAAEERGGGPFPAGLLPPHLNARQRNHEVGTHSIRSRSAMADYLGKCPVFMLMLIDRWSSNAFLRYI